MRVGIKLRSALMSSVFRKTFQLAQLHNEGSGNVVSLVSTGVCYPSFVFC